MEKIKMEIKILKSTISTYIKTVTKLNATFIKYKNEKSQ